MMDHRKINARLERLYGRDTVYDKPKFRVVRSETQTENRTGTYEMITDSGLYLGTRTGTREIMKYWHIPACFVLEIFQKTADDLAYQYIKAPYSYEPLYTFLDKNDKPLPLLWKACEIVVQNYLSAIKHSKRMKTAEDFRLDDMAMLEIERRNILDELKNTKGELVESLEAKEAVSMAGVKPFKGVISATS